VIADSHVGEFIEELRPGVLETLAGCDAVVHAGDICDIAVLDQLRRIGPVYAVRGDHDFGAARALPRDLVLTAGSLRIGVTHGRRPRPLEYSVVLSHLAARRSLSYDAGLHRALISRFRSLDCLIYGHWHQPLTKRVGSVLCFSPGAVCPWGSLEGGREPRGGLTGVQDRVIRRYRKLMDPELMRPRVGIIEIDGGRLSARSIPVD